MAAASAPSVFAGKVIALAGYLKLSSYSWQKKITEMGGKISYLIDAQVGTVGLSLCSHSLARVCVYVCMCVCVCVCVCV
jgi:hypothetical protein